MSHFDKIQKGQRPQIQLSQVFKEHLKRDANYLWYIGSMIGIYIWLGHSGMGKELIGSALRQIMLLMEGY